MARRAEIGHCALGMIRDQRRRRTSRGGGRSRRGGGGRGMGERKVLVDLRLMGRNEERPRVRF